MVRRILLSTALLVFVASTGGCLSLNFDENVRQINHYGKAAHEMRLLTNKYFFDYDQENPFED